ncbi:hypothetical protein [Mesorhizobium sp. CAU 1741]|uniref:cell division protein FtsL n=1 Tax=Mesorhizobium sp. CAU 1741 TaxID=3140366 RepID=UPI00325BFC31
MFRTTDIVLIAAMVAAAGFTYMTKHGAEAELSKLRRLQSDIRLEEEAIDVLKADWSLLTQPSRLQRLAEIYHSELQLAPVESHQFADISELPERPLEIEDFLNDELDGIVDSGIDATTTSGVSE